MNPTPGAADRGRDAVMWSGYALISGWAFFIYLIGPSTAVIGDDLALSDTAAGFIGTMMAAGLVGSGFVGPRSVARWGRAGTLLRAAVGLGIATAVIAAAPGFPVVLLGAALGGLSGAVLANTATAVLAEHRPARRAEVITEGNAVAAWVGLFAPAILGALLAVGPGWRAAMLVASGVALVLLVPIRRILAPAEAARRAAAATGTGEPVARAVDMPPKAPLPLTFWAAVTAVGAAAATEFSVNFWGATLIADRTGAELAAATAAMTASVIGVAVGRTLGAGLPRRFDLVFLVVGFFLTALVGVVLLVGSTVFALSVAALFVCGLGISVLYPFAQAMAIHAASDQPDRAVAIVGVALGVSLGAAPFLLGWVADLAGVLVGFSLVLVFVAVGVLAAVVYGRAARAA